MRGREHAAIAGGSVAAAWFGAQAAGVPLETVGMVLPIGAAVAGSLAPDLDHPRSLAAINIPVWLIVGGGGILLLHWLPQRIPALAPLDLSGMWDGLLSAAWTAVGAGLLLSLLAAVATAVFGHRGVVHSVGVGAGAAIFVLVVTLALGGSAWLALAFAWGWATHLMTDAMTPAGLDFAVWPLTARSRGQCESPLPLRSRVTREDVRRTAEQIDVAPQDVDAAIIAQLEREGPRGEHGGEQCP